MFYVAKTILSPFSVVKLGREKAEPFRSRLQKVDWQIMTCMTWSELES